jgi:hypothetical protein
MRQAGSAHRTSCTSPACRRSGSPIPFAVPHRRRCRLPRTLRCSASPEVSIVVTWSPSPHVELRSQRSAGRLRDLRRQRVGRGVDRKILADAQRPSLDPVAGAARAAERFPVAPGVPGRRLVPAVMRQLKSRRDFDGVRRKLALVRVPGTLTGPRFRQGVPRPLRRRACRGAGRWLAPGAGGRLLPGDFLC